MLRLIPVDEHYYAMLQELAASLPAAASLLADVLNDPTRGAELVPAVRRAEDATDALAARIVARLEDTFVTPLGREDIHGLVQQLDVVSDLIEAAAESVAAFHLTEVDRSTRAMADVLVRITEVLARATASLGNPRGVPERLREAGALQEEVERLYARAIVDILAGEPDPVEVLRQKGICDGVQCAVDACQEVCDLLESISIKQR
ncbi:MAG: DUF47 family protein [Gemmatimonadetes bacterium]|nr:DUF47 family protein [Gemmatimonadota bacterium]